MIKTILSAIGSVVVFCMAVSFLGIGHEFADIHRLGDAAIAFIRNLLDGRVISEISTFVSNIVN